MYNKSMGSIMIIIILMVISSLFLYFYSSGVSFSSNSSGELECAKRNSEGKCLIKQYTCRIDDSNKCICKEKYLTITESEWTCDKSTGECIRIFKSDNGYKKEVYEGCTFLNSDDDENNTKGEVVAKNSESFFDMYTVIFLFVFVISFVSILMLILGLKKKNQIVAYIVLLSLLIIIYGLILFNSIIFSIRTGNSLKKPILYLYPEENIDVKISFKNEDILKTTYPKYNNGWEVHVKSDGSITDDNGRSYYALYWDEEYDKKVDFSTGFYVKSEDSIKFLEEKLNEIGLTEREANEFIMYWLPIMEEKGNNLVHFEFTKDREKMNKLNIEPKPDSMLRLGIIIKKVDKNVKIKEQKIEHFDRVGFSVVEWGGTIYE